MSLDLTKLEVRREYAYGLYLQGKTPKEIAKVMGVSERTAYRYVQQKEAELKAQHYKDHLDRYRHPDTPRPKKRKKTAKKKSEPEIIAEPVREVLKLPAFVKDIMNIQKAFISRELPCTVKDAIMLREEANRLDSRSDIPGWSVPSAVASTKRQMEIVDAICNPSIGIVMIEGDKRTGKSTSSFIGIVQAVWEGKISKIGVWAAGQENAKGILNDVFNDDITCTYTYPLFRGTGSLEQKVFWNGALIKALSSNAVSTSGLDFDCCWIDECHAVVEQYPEVFNMIAMTMRAKPNIKLILSMNRGTAVYEYFKNTLLKNIKPEQYRFFTLTKNDVHHITEAADSTVRTIVKAVGGQKEVDRWLDNVEVRTGTAFNPVSIRLAYERKLFFNSEAERYGAYRVLAFDPSGSGHPMGWFVGATNLDGTMFWELDSGEMQLADSMTDVDKKLGLTPEQVHLKLLNIAREYNITLFISEPNMNGQDMVLYMQQNGIQAIKQSFAGPNAKKGASRGRMIHICRHILDSNIIKLEGETLRAELMIYNPDQHEKVAKFKGDVADAFIHTIYRLALISNSRYLNKMQNNLTFI